LLEEHKAEATYTPPKVQEDPHYVIGELNFCSDLWPPYAGKADKVNQGYVIDIIKAIFEPLGYFIVYENIPWSRCIRETRDGVFHGLAGADIQQVPDFIFPTQTVGTTQPQFFTRPGNPWKYQGLQSLDDVRLGSIQDYTYTAVLDVYIRQHQSDPHLTIVNGESGLRQLIDLLEANRIDVFVEDASVVHATLQQLNISQKKLKPAGVPGVGVLLYVPFSPRYQESRELVDIFDRGIVQLRKNGQLQKILSRYQLSDWLDVAARIEKHNLGLED
jgi:polar amino acid transport system substrate-binding protein